MDRWAPLQHSWTIWTGHWAFYHHQGLSSHAAEAFSRRFPAGSSILSNLRGEKKTAKVPLQVATVRSCFVTPSSIFPPNSCPFYKIWHKPCKIWWLVLPKKNAPSLCAAFQQLWRHVKDLLILVFFLMCDSRRLRAQGATRISETAKSSLVPKSCEKMSSVPTATPRPRMAPLLWLRSILQSLSD